MDPEPDEENSPDISVQNNRSISEVGWIGFSTGAKTEFDDKIDVWDIRVSDSWRVILDLPSELTDADFDADHSRTNREKTVSFREDIFPLLSRRCFECHEGHDAEEGIRLDVVDEVLNQVTPFQSEQSRLYQLVRDHEMPPDGSPLSDEESRLIATWIDEGLDWDLSLLPIPVPETDHWAFQPIQRPEIPRVKNRQWMRTPVDAFIAAPA